MSASLRVHHKGEPDRLGTITGVAPAKAHHAALLGTTFSFTVTWDSEFAPVALSYGEDVLEFLDGLTGDVK